MDATNNRLRCQRSQVRAVRRLTTTDVEVPGEELEHVAAAIARLTPSRGENASHERATCLSRSASNGTLSECCLAGNLARGEILRGDRYHRRLQRGEVICAIAVGAELFGAVHRVVPGIKTQNDQLAPVL